MGKRATVLTIIQYTVSLKRCYRKVVMDHISQSYIRLHYALISTKLSCDSTLRNVYKLIIKVPNPDRNYRPLFENFEKWFINIVFN